MRKLVVGMALAGLVVGLALTSALAPSADAASLGIKVAGPVQGQYVCYELNCQKSDGTLVTVSDCGVGTLASCTTEKGANCDWTCTASGSSTTATSSAVGNGTAE